MARACGLSVSTVQRIWRAFGLQPHRLKTFKLSTAPDFVALADAGGLAVVQQPSFLSHCGLVAIEQKALASLTSGEK